MDRLNLVKAGENAYMKTDKVLIKDLEHIDLVNEHLEKMGHNIGVKIIDEFLAKSNLPMCDSFEKSGEVLCKVAIKMFLGVTADATQWDASKTAFTIVLHENPLNEFVELPPHLLGLNYSSLLCGVVRGAFEELRMKVKCTVERDSLKGESEQDHFRVQLLEVMRDFIDDDA